MATVTVPPTSDLDKQPSGEPLSGAELVVRGLLGQGVDTMFAYPGGFSMPLHQALTRFREQIRVILPRHEQGGGFAAQGYARSTGKPGVCMATSGPGATNLVTAIADAKLDSIPLIALTGQVPTTVIGSDAFQETPIVEVCRTITKHHYLVTDARDIPRILREAFQVATTGRPGPVLIDLPKDVQTSMVVGDFDAPLGLPGYCSEPPRVDRHQIEALVKVIRRARRPVIYAGGGIIASNAADELFTLVEKTGIPVTTTLLALGAFPGDHPLCLDMLGMHGSVYANYAANQCDLLLALGARFDDRVTGLASEFAPRATIVHVDVDASEINKNRQTTLALHCDVKQALVELNRVVQPPKDLAPWHRRIASWRKQHPLNFDTASPYILPQQAIQVLSELTRDRDTIVATGVGQHQMWTAQFFKFRRPRTCLSSGGLGTMGFGLPAAMGAKAAHPNSLVIDIDGDGSLLMNVQEMATCYCEKLPIKVMLLNNQHLGMVMQLEDHFCEGNRAQTYLGPVDAPEAVGEGNGLVELDQRYPDFVAIAQGYGWQTRRVHKKAELREALQEMIDSDGPFLLDVATPYQQHVLPMIPAGMTVRELIKE